MGNYRYKFSVIVPVYQVEDYLEEAISSVVEQTVGFEDCVQLVLVNDGSRDDSESICLRCRNAYPENVIYVRQDNAGVSAARNAGLQHARGEFINFLDSDDKWDRGAFAEVLTFFESTPDVDVAVARIAFFDARTDFHPTDYRFGSGTDVVSITDEPDRVHMNVSSAFIRHTAIGKRVFDVHLRYAEDFAFIAPIILQKGLYGALGAVTYWYRRRSARDSAINMSMRSRAWYNDTLERCHAMLFELSRGRYGQVIPFLQHCVMYDLQVRLRTRLSPELTAEDIVRYKALISSLLADIDDEVILAQRNIYTEHKLYALALKQGMSITDLRRSLRIEDGVVFHGAQTIRNLHRGQKMFIEFLEFDGDQVRIEGHITSVIEPSSVSVLFDIDGRRVEADLVDRPERRRYSLGDLINDAVGFVALIPLLESQTIAPVVRLRDFEVEPVSAYGPYAKLTESMETSYLNHDDWFATRRGRNRIRVRRDSRPLANLRREWHYLKELTQVKERKDLARYRVLRFLLRPLLFGRKVWVISDRIALARDNGEAFFRYVTAHRSWRVLPYYALSPDSEDYAALKHAGKVVNFDSFKHRLLVLLADAVISSAADEYVTSPFGDDDIYMKNLFGFKFAFLQHGVTQDDLSRWLNRYNKNIRVFITSAVPEYESILRGAYHYTERELRLTGLPRHDQLLAGDPVLENKVVLMPTWRSRLAGELDRATGLRPRFQGFRKSDFFRFYDSLINDPRVLEALRNNGMTLKFAIHPALVQEADSFTANELVSIEDDCDYAYEFRSARLMITDFSSVAFDFALLGKPVVYTQFDRETFFQNHTRGVGYFSYEDDGFGPVCTDYEQSVSAIVDLLNDGCRMSDVFRARAASFFYRGESSACESVYQAVLDA